VAAVAELLRTDAEAVQLLTLRAEEAVAVHDAHSAGAVEAAVADVVVVWTALLPMSPMSSTTVAALSMKLRLKYCAVAEVEVREAAVIDRRSAAADTKT
jgi:hypothetical protein